MWSPRRRSNRRLALVALLPLAWACAADRDGDDGREEPSATAVTTVVPDRDSTPPTPVDIGGPLLGDGIALDALAGPDASGMVVVTTAGWLPIDADGIALGELVPTADAAAYAARSADGTRLATISGDPARLTVHDIARRTPRFDVDLGVGAAEILTVSASGTGGFVTATTTAITRWNDTGAGEVLIEAAVDGKLQSAVVLPDGGGAYAVQRDQSSATSLLAWSPRDGRTTIEIDPDPLTQLGSLVASPDGSLLAVEVFPPDGTVRLAIVDPAADTAPAELDLGGVTARAWAVLDDGTVVLVRDDGVELRAAGGGTTTALDLTDVERVVAPPAGGVTVALVRKGGGLVVTDATGREVREIEAVAGPLRAAHRLADDALVATTSSGTIVRWELDRPAPTLVVDAYAPGAVTDVELSADGSALAVARDTGIVEVRSGDGGTMTFDHRGRNVDSIAMAPDRSTLVSGVGERLAATAFDDTVTRWDVATGYPTHVVGGEGESVAGCSFFSNLIRYSPDGNLVAVNSHDFTVSLLRADDMTTVTTFPGHGSNVLDVAFSPDGRTLATSAEDFVVRFWDVDDASLIREWPAPLGGYWAIEFSPDGESLAGIGSTGRIDLVEPETGASRVAFEGAASWSSNVVFTPAGDRLVAGSADGDVLSWSVADGAVVDRFEGHTADVTAVTLSGDGSTLYSGSVDGTVRRWELAGRPSAG